MERLGTATWPVQPRGSGRALREAAEIQVCVKKVYPLRFSAEHGQQKYEEFFEQFNDPMHK
jgi:hypothetical protein